MFPGTYTVENDTTAEQFRDMLLAAFGANVSPQMRADAAAQGVTFYQALVIASVVQREVRSPETQKLVASVIYNRYRDGNRLAADRHGAVCARRAGELVAACDGRGP